MPCHPDRDDRPVPDRYHPSYSTPLILLLVSVILFIPGIGAGSWKKEGKEIAWDGYFIIGAALAFSNLLGTYKVMDFIAAKISLLNIHSYAIMPWRFW